MIVQIDRLSGWIVLLGVRKMWGFWVSAQRDKLCWLWPRQLADGKQDGMLQFGRKPFDVYALEHLVQHCARHIGLSRHCFHIGGGTRLHSVKNSWTGLRWYLANSFSATRTLRWWRHPAGNWATCCWSRACSATRWLSCFCPSRVTRCALCAERVFANFSITIHSNEPFRHWVRLFLFVLRPFGQNQSNPSDILSSTYIPHRDITYIIHPLFIPSNKATRTRCPPPYISPISQVHKWINSFKNKYSSHYLKLYSALSYDILPLLKLVLTSAFVCAKLIVSIGWLIIEPEGMPKIK